MISSNNDIPHSLFQHQMYEIICLNKYTSVDVMIKLIDHVQQCTQFTTDTESEKSNGQLALIQIQTVPPQLPSLIILIELALGMHQYGRTGYRSDWVSSPTGYRSDWVSSPTGYRSDWVSSPTGYRSDWVSSPTGYRSDWVSSLTGYRSDWVTGPTG